MATVRFIYVADITTALVRVSGPDHPGITTELMGILGTVDGVIQDVEQVVVRRQLVLGVVVALALSDAIEDELRSFGSRHGLTVDISEVDPNPTEQSLGVIITVMGREVEASHFARVSDSIAANGGNIDRIVRLAKYPVTAYELEVSGSPIDTLRAPLGMLAHETELDIAIQNQGIGRRAQRLVVLDVDSTLIQDEIVDLLADEAGVGEEVAAITERAMAGEIDFEAALRARVALLKGLDAKAMARARDNVRLTPGARTFVRTLKRLGFRVAIVSGGFTFFTDHLREELGLDHAVANTLEVESGLLTGDLHGPVVDRARKALMLKSIAEAYKIPLDQTVAVGDGANDLDMLAAAGLGIAFNAKALVREAADTSINVPYLDALLFVLGVRRKEVEEADEADGTPTHAPPVG